MPAQATRQVQAEELRAPIARTQQPQPKAASFAPARSDRARVPATPPHTVRKSVTPAQAFGVIVTALLVACYLLPTSAYLSPRSGLGYLLGIAGGTMMLVLLVYPLRKRRPQATHLGSTAFWFRLHMVLGILGPVAILVHCNFRFGATNSNVALISMLIVAGSGLFGRYFYNHFHIELHGRQATLDELRSFSSRMRQLTSAVSYLPELAQRIDREEDSIAQRIRAWPMLLRPAVSAWWAAGARRRLRGAVRTAVAGGAERRRDSAREKLQPSAFRYIDHRITATRRVLEFNAFERLFSLWHALHMPLFVMLVIAGIVHVIAVHLY
jgi:hypothetical protein